MAESGFSVFRINYEIEGDTKMNDWTCFIGAASHEDAVNHLANTLKKPFKIITSGMQCRLDDVSMKIRSNVVKKYLIDTGQFVGGAGKPAVESKLEEVAIKDESEKEAKLAKRKL